MKLRFIVPISLFVLAAFAPSIVTPASAADPSVRVHVLYDGLNFPVALNFLPDGRMLYGEWQTGDVRVIENGLVSAPVIHVNVVTGFELGLTEVSLHPDYANHPYVYVFYTFGVQSGWGSTGHYGRLSRFQEISHNVFGPEQILRDGLNAGVAHNDGIMAWGLDGKLYMSHGDVTQYWPAQNPNGWDGRILRLNDDGTIPADNPLGAGNPTWSYGHRAPYGLDFNPITHDLFITENQDNINDEVNIALPGHNYGWPAVQGCSTDPAFTNPLTVHGQTIGPTNGVFYRGLRTPQLTGHFFYGDTNRRQIHELVLRPPLFQRVQAELVTYTDPASIIVDVTNAPDGYLYFTTQDSIKRFEPLVGQGVAGLIPESPLPALSRDLREAAWANEPGLCANES